MLDNLDQIGEHGIQRAKSIEIGIMDPTNAAILIAENGCIALDMNVCEPQVLRAMADLLESKPEKKVEEKPKAKAKAKKAK